MSKDNVDLWRRLTRQLDSSLVPVSFGVLTVLLLAQLATTIPTVRQAVDRVEGRFVVYPSTAAYVKQTEQSATVKLYLSPAVGANHPPIAVVVNGAKMAQITKTAVTIKVHSGDSINLEAPNLKQTLYVTVDHNNPTLVRPAPGRTVMLSPNHTQAGLPAVQFLK